MIDIAAPFGPAALQLAQMLRNGGQRVWFVGGCVRNVLMGRAITDVDLATDAVPQTVSELAKRAGFKAVPTGIAHGTVTVIVNGRPFEVTSLRRDLATDGRHAIVAFATDIAQDAARRDFTMNALYVGPDGQVSDPINGMPDLTAGIVRFIGEPQARIAEDYLRILRFFRFHAWYADPDNGIEAEGLAACAANLDGIERLSRERIGAEMKKLLSAPDPGPAVAAMGRCGALIHVLPGAGAASLPVLVHVEQVAGMIPDPIRRLAILGGEDVADRLRLSRSETARLERLTAAMVEEEPPHLLGHRLGIVEAMDVLALKSALSGREIDPAKADQARFGAAQVFAVSAADLPDLQDAALGLRLRALRAAWVASGFSLSKTALLARDD